MCRAIFPGTELEPRCLKIGKNMQKKTILKWCLIPLSGLLLALAIFVFFILWLLSGTNERMKKTNKEFDNAETKSISLCISCFCLYK